MKIKIENPLIVFIIIWFFVITCFYFPLIGIVLKGYNNFHILILFTLYVSVFLLLIPYALGNKLQQSIFSLEISKLEASRINFLFFVYLLIQSFQFVVFNGFPLLWILTGVPKTYADFGIPGLNGLNNSIFMVIITSYFFLYLESKSKKYLLRVIFLSLFPVLVLSRQLMMSSFLQIFAVMLLTNKIERKHIFRFTIFILLLFILLGNLRTGLDQLVYLLDPIPSYPKSLYFLLWIYAYFITPANNIVYNFDKIYPSNNFYHELVNLLPFGINNTDPSPYNFDLVVKNLNVSTGYRVLLLDFGQIYTSIWMTIVLIVSFVFYRKAFTGKYKDIIRYSIIYHLLVLFVFENLFVILAFIFQFIIIKFISFNKRFVV